jgi:hypothetical protein
MEISRNYRIAASPFRNAPGRTDASGSTRALTKKTMTNQSEYNEWFKMMLSKHLTKHKYELTGHTYEGIDYLIATVFHPDDKEKKIEISTYGRELTLSFWKHHEHHDSFEDDNHEEEFKKLCDYMDDIWSDKVLFSVGYKADRIAYGTASYELDDLIDREVDRVEIKSWSGEHDQIIEKNG